MRTTATASASERPKPRRAWRCAICVVIAFAFFEGEGQHALSSRLQQGDAAPSVGVRGDARVVHYDVALEPDLRSQSITGVETLTVDASDGPTGDVVIDRGVLVIDAVEEQGRPVAFALEGNRLRIIPTPGIRKTRRQFTVRYHGTPRSGLVFVPEREQIYTVFSTSQWMPAMDAPSARATLRLRLTVPDHWVAVGSGRERSRRRLPASRMQVEWRQDRAVPSYTFGFVAGRFTEVSQRSGGVTFRAVGGGWSSDELARVFRDSADMVAFFERMAGVRFPGDGYTQALVARTVGQEMAGLSLLSDEYGRTVLADPTAVGLIGHELAHQWWGNMLTCGAWTEMWLNEGVATFMAAAYREHRFGRETYDRDIEAIRRRFEDVRSRGLDRPLIFPSWDRPTADDRVIVYQKGALFLHELRQQLGEGAFWSGIRRYTRAHMGSAVTSAHLRAALERESGRNLEEVFKQWGGMK